MEDYLAGLKARIEALLEESMNSEVKLIALSDFDGVEAGGFKIPRFERDSEVRLPLWAAVELVKSGIAEFKEGEAVDLKVLSKLHWIEVVQPSKVVSALPENFYVKLKLYLAMLKSRVPREPERIGEYEKALRMAGDIVASRIRKVVDLALTRQPSQILSNLTVEERLLYDAIHGAVEAWREAYGVGGG